MKLKVKLSWLGYLILIPSLLLNGWQFWQSKSQQTTYLVKEVIDGDTFVTDNKIKVRLANLDAPALEFCGGKEAKQLLEELILNKRVKLETFNLDVFKRLLAYVYVDQKFVNQLLLESGWVEYERGGKNYIKERLRQIYLSAMEQEKGIFRSPCTQKENPNDRKCVIKGNIGRDDKSKLYHFPSCRDYDQVLVEMFRGEQWFCNEKEAQAAGYIKAKTCYNENQQ
ncbi:MAG: thermonuclease family protein [Candidatus Beckwithbacteria bacterium]|nr:thermonuclease family protein [Candidatus Beckwithbacteria bacterium]